MMWCFLIRNITKFSINKVYYNQLLFEFFSFKWPHKNLYYLTSNYFYRIKNKKSLWRVWRSESLRDSGNLKVWLLLSTFMCKNQVFGLLLKLSGKLSFSIGRNLHLFASSCPAILTTDTNIWFQSGKTGLDSVPNLWSSSQPQKCLEIPVVGCK